MHHVYPRIHTIQSAKLLFFFGTHKHFDKNLVSVSKKCVGYVSSTNGACLPHLWICFMVVFYFLGKLKW